LGWSLTVVTIFTGKVISENCLDESVAAILEPVIFPHRFTPSKVIFPLLNSAKMTLENSAVIVEFIYRTLSG
jgi:hypothetical protein